MINIAIQIGLAVVSGILQWVAEQTLNFMLLILPKISSAALLILDLPVVNNTMLYMQIVAITLLAVKVAYEGVMNYILRISGDPEADPAGLIKRTILATVSIIAIPTLVKLVYNFCVGLSADIAGLDTSGPAEEGNTMVSFLMALMSPKKAYILFVAAGIVFSCVVVVIVLIQTSIRAAEIAGLGAAGAIMALSLTNTGQYFSAWWKQLLTISATQVIQMFFLKLSFYLLLHISVGEEMVNLCFFCGALYCTFKSPQWAKELSSSTGVGQLLGGAAQQAGSMVLMRKMMTRGV